MYTDDTSRTYDPAALRKLDDQRFRIAKNDAVFAQCFTLVYCIAVILTVYLMQPGSAGEVTYILGFPAWFFAAACISVFSFILICVYLTRISKQVPLSATWDETETKGGEPV